MIMLYLYTVYSGFLEFNYKFLHADIYFGNKFDIDIFK